MAKDKEQGNDFKVEPTPNVVEVKESSVIEPNMHDNAEKYKEQVNVNELNPETEPEEPNHEEIAKEIVEEFNKSQLDGEEADDKEGDDNSTPKPEEGEVAEEQSKEEPKDSEIPVFSEELLAGALSVGMTITEAKTLSPESLAKTLDIMYRNATQNKGEAPKQVDEFKLDIKEDDYDEDDPTLKLLKGMESEINRQRKEMSESNSKQAEVTQATQRQSAIQAQNAFYNDFDRTLNALSEEEQKLFGTGKGDDMKQDTPEFKNRLTLLEEVDIIAGGYLQRGKEVPEISVLVDKAKKIAFSDELQKASLNEVTNKIKKRSKSMVLKPSASQTENVIAGDTAEEKSYNAAVADVAQQLKEFAS